MKILEVKVRGERYKVTEVVEVETLLDGFGSVVYKDKETEKTLVMEKDIVNYKYLGKIHRIRIFCPETQQNRNFSELDVKCDTTDFSTQYFKPEDIEKACTEFIRRCTAGEIFFVSNSGLVKYSLRLILD